MSETLTIHTYPWETIKAQALLDENAALRQEIDRLTAERDAFQRLAQGNAEAIARHCADQLKAEQELESTRHQLRDTANERNQAEQEREQSWNRFAVVGNHADFLQRLDTLLLTSAQAEQERDRLQHTVEEQRATITYLEGLRHE